MTSPEGTSTTTPATEPATTAPEASATTPATEGKPWSPPATQAELDAIVQKRLERERAKFSDYEALAQKAAMWDEIEAESQTDYERQAEALEAAESRYMAAQERIVSAELKAAGVPAPLLEDLDLSKFIDGDGDIAEDRIAALAEKFAGLTATTSQRMAPNPAQGTSAQPPLSTAERLAQAEQAGDIKTAMRIKAQMAVGTTTR